MLVLLLCCMMKIVEFSTGKTMGVNARSSSGKQPQQKQRRYTRKRGKTMTEVGGLGVRGIAITPDSDCNSNHHGSTSYISNTSSQDIDFIQDNSDYQWFLDYGYRDGSGLNHHPSILSLPESYETNDINYYDTLAKNMDANLAEADMESFRTEDIHALLTNLPPICSDHLSQENNRQGECFASVSGSMMAKFDFDSSISPHSSSQGDDSTSMSIYKSELLFSPVKDVPAMLGQNFSVDSLDCDMMLTCQANKDNYTIAFEASTTMYSEDSDYHDNDKNDNLCGSSDNVNLKKHTNLKLVDNSMTQSDCGSLTTWSKLKKRNCSENQLRRHPSGNNNSNNNELNANTNLNECTIKSQSMPNLYKQKLKTLLLNSYIKQQNMANIDVKRKPVKVFDIQHQIQNSTSETTIDTTNENTTNKQPNFSLVKLFMKQKSLSTEVMSTTMDQFSSTENCAVSQSDDSSSETKNTERIDMSIEQKFNESTSGRTYDLIVEEPEQEDLSRSESVEQLSESVSKIDSVTDSYENNQDNNNGSCTELKNRQNRDELASKSIQTSQFSEIINLKNSGNCGNKPLYRIIEPSFLSKLKQESEKLEKPVYVLYPNYCLPNLDFLNEPNFAEILLMPHDPPVINKNNSNNNVKKRPFSFNDIETLRKKGFNHIKDWDSLNFLLPQEYRKILADVPEISEHIKPKLRQPSKYRRRPMSCDYTILTTNSSSSSSTTTQPSSGYRGSSTILTDSSQNSPANQPTANLNPLFVYRYDSVTSSEASLLVDRPKPITTAPPLPVRCVSLQQQQENLPPRPPLPKTILRRDLENKRYSLYETSEEDLTEDRVYKRRSLQEPYYLTTRNKRLSETEDEGVDAGTTPTTTSSSSIEEQPAITTTTTTTTTRQYRNFLSNITNDELLQLEEFLKISGISTSDDELTEENLVQLKSYVSRFLSLKMNQTEKSTRNFDKFTAPNNSPNVSAFIQQKNYHTKTLVDMPICEESEGSPSYSSPQTTPIHRVKSINNLDEKRSLITDVTDSIELIINHFSLATNQNDLNTLGDTTLNPYCGKLVLTKLCPAIYAILSDCLKPNLETSFGAINNSVWQVIEASSQQGLLTKALNELVMKINSEDILTEGLVKFNAFIFGLLNVRSLDAWLSYLRTRESIIKKHYDKDSILLMAQTNSNVRTLLDGLIDALQPLALLPFQLDLLFEYRQLHLSFKRMDSYQQQQQQQSPVHKHPSSPIIDFDTIKSNKERPRSCVETGVTKPSFKLGDLTQASKKRWSGIALNSKLYLAYDKLVKDDEEYSDSLENPQFNRNNNDDTDNGPESLDSNLSDEKPLNSRRFKKLQQKWENLSGPDNQQQVITPNKSKIPRPITSPVHKPSGIPVLISPSSKSNNKSLTKKPPVTTNFNVSYNKGGNRALQNKKTTATRTSRVDQMDNNELQRHIPRPSSLPYKPISAQNAKTTSKLTPPRRAASSSLNRKPPHKSNLPKTVRTLSHRVPSESGHLPYNEGERLKVILDVDDKWLLCSRGTQKGLVPRSAVIAADF